jgi:apolipoprotein N-acyltransferase
MSSVPPNQPSWQRSTLAIALTGNLLLWAALPPLSLGWLVWIAPVPWLLLVRAEELPGRRPYRALWLAGFVFWLLAIHWLRLPHPAVYLGWIALSAYLALYLPAFVGLSRVAVHRLGVPVWISAPAIFTGLELARAHLLTGFLMASLAHTQVNWTTLIQISDLFGEYGVDFVIMLVAACITNGFRISNCGLRTGSDHPESAIHDPKSQERKVSWQPHSLIPGVVVLAGTLLYGHFRLEQIQGSQPKPPRLVRIALIQGNSLADWKTDTAKQQQIMNEYIELSQDAVTKAKTMGDGRPLDLIVWPETMYRNPLREFEAGYKSPEGIELTTEEITASDRRILADLAAHLGAPLLAGIDRVRFLAGEWGSATRPRYDAYNSAVLVDRRGDIVGTYDKIHLVMFGEYVPFSDWLPFLNKISSVTGSVLPGEGPVSLCTGGVCYAPSICYETVIPHVTRRQVKLLNDSSRLPGVLVNMTNDAWYWGSSELDQHLACGVFRAIETRTPLVIAANGGISAWIDSFGRIRAQSPKQKPDIIIADVELGHVYSSYLTVGDIFAGACLTCCVALAIIGWVGRRGKQ